MDIQSVVILGAGIGGLSAAHQLRKRGFKGQITILEAADIIGGQARSSYVHGSQSGGGGVPKLKNDPDTQYCWRIYGPSYKVLRALFKEIPLMDDPTKTVFDNLVDTELYLVAGAHGQSFRLNYSLSALRGYNQMMSKVSIFSKYRLISKILTLVLCCKARLLSEYERISWPSYLGKLTHEEKVYAVDAVGPFLGFDIYNTSANSVGTILEGAIVNRGNLSVMNGPTSYAWFRHWYAYLTQQLNVTIRTNCPVINISTLANRVEFITYYDKASGQSQKLTADRFICALPIEVIANLCPQVNSYQLLANRGLHDMVAMTIYWSSLMTFPHANTGIYIAESPWQLIIEPCGEIWSQPINYLGGKIQDSWNIGLCDPQRRGTYIQKSWLQCTPQEIYQEIVWQLQNTLSLSSQVSSEETGLSISQVQPVGFNLWQGYKFQNGRLHTQDPKFGPNKDTYSLRPNTQSRDLTNLLFSTVYVSNPFVPILMDQAANAGVMAAKAIVPVSRHTDTDADHFARADRFDRAFPILLAPFRVIDRVCWQFDLGTPFHFQPILWLLLYVYVLFKIFY